MCAARVTSPLLPGSATSAAARGGAGPDGGGGGRHLEGRRAGGRVWGLCCAAAMGSARRLLLLLLLLVLPAAVPPAAGRAGRGARVGRDVGAGVGWGLGERERGSGSPGSVGSCPVPSCHIIGSASRQPRGKPQMRGWEGSRNPAVAWPAARVSIKNLLLADLCSLKLHHAKSLRLHAACGRAGASRCASWRH